MQRREKEVRGGRERELEKVKEDRKCFEWVWLRRDSRRRKRRGRTEESGESVATNRVCGVNRKERLGGGGAALEERIQWRRGCISSTSQANYSAANPLFYLSSGFLLSLCPLLSLSLSLPLSHFPYLGSNYPCAVSSNRSLYDTGVHWQVLSSFATIGKEDLKEDKIGPTNSDNSKHITAWRMLCTVLHCHLVAGSSAGPPYNGSGNKLQVVALQ